MKSFFFDSLPADLQIEILQSWISGSEQRGLVWSLAMLDSACTNHRLRPELLLLLSRLSATWNYDCDVKLPALIRWLDARNIALPMDIVVYGGCDGTTTDDYLPDAQQTAAEEHACNITLYCEEYNFADDRFPRTVAALLPRAAACPRMRTITFGNSLICAHDKPIEKECFATVQLIGSQLRELHGVKLSDGLVSVLAAHCSNLQVLQCTAADSNCMDQLATLLKACDLSELVLKSCHRELLEHVSEFLQVNGERLKKVSFQDFSPSMGPKLKHTFAEVLERCPLDSWQFSGHSYDRRSGELGLLPMRPDLTKDMLSRIFDGCNLVNKLKIGMMPFVSASELVQEIGDRFGGSLQELILEQLCHSDQRVNAVLVYSISLVNWLVSLFSAIVRLTLTKCAVDDTTLKTVARKCKCLQYLNIADDSEISDAGTHDLFNGCDALTEIRFGGNCGITWMTFQVILDFRMKLHRFELRWSSPAVNEDAIERFNEEARKAGLVPVMKFIIGNVNG